MWCNVVYTGAMSTTGKPLRQSVTIPPRPARRVRALRLGDQEDIALLAASSRGEFATAGFRNRDLRALLFPTRNPRTDSETRRLSARTSRRLRLLRAHGVITKVPHTHRYRLTPRGHLLTAALSATRSADIRQLIAKAA